MEGTWHPGLWSECSNDCGTGSEAGSGRKVSVESMDQLFFVFFLCVYFFFFNVLSTKSPLAFRDVLNICWN